jgi:dTDP-4-dehydrorhamnose 3,5-epimerase
MEVKSLSIPDVKIVKLDAYADNRGVFMERYHREKFKDMGVNDEFLQDNYSISMPRVIRGMHLQKGQSKLVSVLSGKIIDVVVDMRVESATFGQHVKYVLSAENPELIYVPDGFAHGFANIGDASASVSYKVSAIYDPQKEKGISLLDSDFNIDWGIENPIISERDKSLPTMKEYLAGI